MTLVNGGHDGLSEEVDFDKDFNDTPMFTTKVLQQLNLNSSEPSKVRLRGMSSLLHPAESLIVRPLTTADYHRGFVTLLSQLSNVGNVTEEMFLKRYSDMKSCPGTYYVIVIEDTSRGKLAATGCLVVEQKFLHKCAVRGRIEDIVVSDEYRGKQLGKVIVECLRLLSINLGCYKTSLECTHDLLAFYEQFGFEKDMKNNYMIQRYKD